MGVSEPLEAPLHRMSVTNNSVNLSLRYGRGFFSSPPALQISISASSKCFPLQQFPNSIALDLSVCLVTLKSLISTLPAPIPPPPGLLLLRAPQLNDSNWIHPLWCSGVASPSTSFSFKYASNAMGPSLSPYL